jgi:uncharacterized protein YndB with AHSA1/START domain
MVHKEKTVITVKTAVNVPVSKVWKHWTSPESIKGWNFASDDWHSPKVTNDVRKNGKFNVRMEAKDGSMGFDFWGTYYNVVPEKKIDYTMGDGRKVEITFSSNGKTTEIVESFEAESENPVELQRNGWQSILDNFRKYAESHK